MHVLDFHWWLMFYEPFSNNVSAYLLKHIFKLLLVFLRDLLLCMIHAGILETTFAIFEPHREVWLLTHRYFFPCSDMNGLLGHSTNQWSWSSLTGQQSENLYLGPLILGAWVSVSLPFHAYWFYWILYFSKLATKWIGKLSLHIAGVLGTVLIL